MVNFPQNYQNLFDPDKDYTKHLHYPKKLLTAAEANELQDTIDYKRQKLADILLHEGDIVSGGSPVVKAGGEVIIPAGAVYVNKDIRKYAQQTFTIPTNVKLKLGVFLTQEIITSVEDPDLLDPSGSIAPGVTYASSGLETSQRLKESVNWGYVTAAGTRSQAGGIFYPSVDVDNGVLIIVGTVPVLAEVENLVVNYNNNVNGSYVINGVGISFDYDDTEDGDYVYSVEPGLVAVLGRQISRSTSERIEFAKDPDTQAVTSDPETISTGARTFTATITKGAANGTDALPRPDVLSIVSVKQGGTTYTVTTDYTLSGNNISWAAGGAEPTTGSTYTVEFTFTGAIITVDRGPINAVSGVTTQLRVTKTLTRGITANGADNLPSGFIPAVQIISIAGYTQGTDYTLVGSTVSWAPGGSEPTAGATYDVVYTYNKSILPDAGSIGYDTFTISNQGADGTIENGTVCNTNYTYNLKRVDLLEITEKGVIRRVKGRGDYVNPNEPTESSDALGLAAVYLDFFNPPVVRRVGNIRVNQKEQTKLKGSIAYLNEVVADLALQVDSIKTSARLSTTPPKGIFTDKFFDTDKQDPGKSNTLSTFNGLVFLPMTLTKDTLDNANNLTAQTLAFTEEEIVVQSKYSAAMKINPFATYTPPEPAVIDVKISQEIKDYIDGLMVGTTNPDPGAWIPSPDTPPIDPDTGTPKPAATGLNYAQTLSALLAAKGKTELTPKGQANLLSTFAKAESSGVTLTSVTIGGHTASIPPSGTVVQATKKKG